MGIVLNVMGMMSPLSILEAIATLMWEKKMIALHNNYDETWWLLLWFMTSVCCLIILPLPP